jgi:hypothetical protein
MGGYSLVVALALAAAGQMDDRIRRRPANTARPRTPCLARSVGQATDAEFFWQPAPLCWTVRPDSEAPSGWQIDYDWPARPIRRH